MTNLRIVLVCFGAAGLLASCGNTCGTIQASNYDQSCSSASDCVGVAEGDSCKGIFCVDCVNAAVNVSAEPQYEADLKNKTAGGLGLVCPCPADPPVTCKAGVCSLGT
jgi:hypothetical protein